MRRLAIALASLAGLTALSMLVFAQAGGSTALAHYSATLNKAQALSVEFTTRNGDGAPVSYTVSLAKPNLVRIDAPDKLIVADGTNITTLYKARKNYIVTPQTDADLEAMLKPDELVLFSPFFDASALNTTAAKDLGTKQLGGVSVQAVQLPLAGNNHSATAYISQADGLVRSAQISVSAVSGMSGEQKTTKRILVTRSFSVSDKADSTLFAFKAPDGSKQITAADLNTDKWYTDLDEAEQVAKQTNRKLFVDFDATWCGPCHMLHDEVLVTDDFKKLSKYFVFVEIDVDAQATVAANYQVTAMPTQMILDAQGAMIDKLVGYGGPDMFYAFINKYASAP
ncbi:MAG: thioredoxin domain-containing protein [Fimbriimonadaceae bacterium]